MGTFPHALRQYPPVRKSCSVRKDDFLPEVVHARHSTFSQSRSHVCCELALRVRTVWRVLGSKVGVLYAVGSPILHVYLNTHLRQTPEGISVPIYLEQKKAPNVHTSSRGLVAYLSL